ncbi:MAG: PQQ-like beta-propeller repeat protein [Planctomycetaceae bacterium]|nr:PQQ-like beta-propeller repeat protein [Planctomycetaceae bacterium]
MTDAPPTASTDVERSAFPRKMIIFTVVVVVLFALVFWQISLLDDLFGIGLDIVSVFSVISGVFLLLAWVVWLLAFSRSPIWKRLVGSACLIAAPFVFVFVFRPVIGGDANFVGLNPIWNAPPKPPEVDKTQATPADLLTESPIDFPRFLGADQNGVYTIDGEIDPAQLSEDCILWKNDIGLGWSGFVARNGFAVTMEQREKMECVSCYDIATGELRWLYEHEARHRDAINLGGIGPRSTPVIHQGNVYAVGAIGNVVCLNGGTGEVIWQVDLNDILGVSLMTMTDRDGFAVQAEENSSLAWGRAGSPLVVDEVLVVPGGGPTGGPYQTLLAFDLQTGEQRWSGGTEMIAYGSPVLATVAGVRQILLTTENAACGYDPATGELLWQVDRPGDTGAEANTSQLTYVSENEVLTSKGYPDGGGELIRLSNVDGRLVPESGWRNKLALKTKLTSPVIHEGHSYSLSNAFLECVRLSDGKRLWKRRGRFGHGQLLLVNGLIVLHSELGTLHLIRATPEDCEEIAEIPTIDGVCWNTLCLYGNRLLVRSHIQAACIELPLK